MLMTEKLFWTDPYQTTLQTAICSVEDDWIGCEQTIFYAFSGGQESDHGHIAGYPVREAQKRGQDIFYQLPKDHLLKNGDRVVMEIDWERRYRLMRHHFAAELVLELVYQRLPDIEKIGAHIAPDKARIDFAWPDNMNSLLDDLTQSAQAIVDSDQPITSAFSDRENQRRYWKIEGFAEVPCGGTHLRRTAEVGKLSLKRKNIGGGKERVEVYAAPSTR